MSLSRDGDLDGDLDLDACLDLEPYLEHDLDLDLDELCWRGDRNRDLDLDLDRELKKDVNCALQRGFNGRVSSQRKTAANYGAMA